MLIYFFNRTFLPFGLEYSVLLAPFLLYYVHQNREYTKLIVPVTGIAIYALIHASIGVHEFAFLVSSIMQILLLTSVVAFLVYYMHESDMPGIFKKIALIKTVLTLVALGAILFEELKPSLWYLVPFTYGEEPIPRLKLFQSEASHYSFALIPLFFYFFWSTLRDFSIKSLNFILLFAVCISLILSFSLGVLAVISVSLAVVILVFSPSLFAFENTRNSLMVLSGVSAVGLVLLFVFHPDNPLFTRIDNLFMGQDTSGRGRTYEAFDVAAMVLDSNNSLFGIGLGQFKIIGREAWIYYYQIIDVPAIVRLPNCMAETLVTYGYLGVLMKLALQVFLFIRFKVYQNVFRLSVFLSVFVYQFTGSYLTNFMEYVVWIIAIVPKFKEFNHINYVKS